MFILILALISKSLFAQIAITEIAPLLFPSNEIGSNITITVNPSDATAARFQATGTPFETVNISIVENRINMTTSSGGQSGTIRVSSFAIQGNNTFDASGIINNIRVGASA